MLEWLDKMRRRQRWRKQKARSRAAAAKLWGTTEDAKVAITDARAERATSWSIALSGMLALIVFVLGLPWVTTGLLLVIGGLLTQVGFNHLAARIILRTDPQHRERIVERRSWFLLRGAAVAGLAAYVAGAALLIFAGGYWLWGFLVH